MLCTARRLFRHSIYSTVLSTNLTVLFSILLSILYGYYVICGPVWRVFDSFAHNTIGLERSLLVYEYCENSLQFEWGGQRIRKTCTAFIHVLHVQYCIGRLVSPTGKNNCKNTETSHTYVLLDTKERHIQHCTILYWPASARVESCCLILDACRLLLASSLLRTHTLFADKPNEPHKSEPFRPNGQLCTVQYLRRIFYVTVSISSTYRFSAWKNWAWDSIDSRVPSTFNKWVASFFSRHEPYPVDSMHYTNSRTSVHKVSGSCTVSCDATGGCGTSCN